LEVAFSGKIMGAVGAYITRRLIGFSYLVHRKFHEIRFTVQTYEICLAPKFTKFPSSSC